MCGRCLRPRSHVRLLILATTICRRPMIHCGGGVAAMLQPMRSAFYHAILHRKGKRAHWSSVWRRRRQPQLKRARSHRDGEAAYDTGWEPCWRRVAAAVTTLPASGASTPPPRGHPAGGEGARHSLRVPARGSARLGMAAVAGARHMRRTSGLGAKCAMPAAGCRVGHGHRRAPPSPWDTCGCWFQRQRGGGS